MVNTKEISITLSPLVIKELKGYSDGLGMPLPKLIERLVTDALEEWREDLYLSALADAVDLENQKFLSHEEVWKELLEKE